MRTTPRTNPILAAVLCLSAGVVAGCGSTQAPDAGSGAETTEAAEAQSSPEQTSGSFSATPSAPGSADEPANGYAGAYDETFRTGLGAYSGQRVTLTGEVGDLIGSRSAYELLDPAEPNLDPLLISAQHAVPDLEVGDLVEVTGTVQEGFQPPVVEEAVAGDEEVGFYDQHLGEPYLDEAQTEITGSPDR